MRRYTRNTKPRLGAYENQKFGGSGSRYGNLDWDTWFQAETGGVSLDTAVGQPIHTAGEQAPSHMLPGGASHISQTKIGTGASQESNWGAIGNFFTGLFKAAAPVAGSIYGQKMQADHQKEMFELAQRNALMQNRPAQYRAAVQSQASNTGLYVGLGAVALVVVLAIVLTRR